MAAGGKGASTVLALHGDLIGCHLTAFYGDSFEQVTDAQQTMLRDSQVEATMAAHAFALVERVFIDII